MSEPGENPPVPGGYTREQLADLDRVLAFNRRLAEAVDQGRDVSAVVHALDPDPLRYMAVDEGGGRIGDYVAAAEQQLTEAPRSGHERADSEPVWRSGAAVRPSVAAGHDGRVLLYAWVEWTRDVGERLLAAFAEPAGSAGEAQALVDRPTDCFRPVALLDRAGRGWVFYARADHVAGEVTVRARRHEHGEWQPEEVVSTTSHPSYNLEAAAHVDGSVEVCWQGRQGGRFAVFSRRWSEGGWGRPRVVSDSRGDNVWDPVVVAAPDGGSGYAWTEYHDGAYRVVVVRSDRDGRLGEPRPLTSGTDYAMHPSLAVTPDGELWCAFDVLTVQGHGGSGPTRLRPAEALGAPASPEGVREPGEHVPAELLPDLAATLRVVRVDDDGVGEPPGELAPALEVIPGGLPRLASDGQGTLHVAYRVLRRLPLMNYYWEVASQSLGRHGWEPPRTYRSSDGPVEEVALAGLPDGAALAWQTDERRERALSWTEGFGGWTAPDLEGHLGHIVWHAVHGTGSLRRAGVPGAADPARPSLRRTQTVRLEARSEARPWARAAREAPRYTTDVDGQRLALYWGDLHRHSIISRCTGADEPSLEDFYRYSWDVCEYDFWAVTDHAENSSDYQWWCIQKAADLFCVDGRFVPLYGFEWTSLTGHQNVIYSSVERGAPIFSSLAEGSRTPAELWDNLRKHPDHPAITIPHHPGAAMVPFDWDYHDEQFVRVAEVFQACRGNYEDDGCFRQYSDATLPGTFVLDGLRRGHRFGLIASSDHGNGAAYLGAYAPTLDRSALFDALWSRRTFAATTRDIVLDVRVAGSFMGGETRLVEPVRVQAYARGFRDLARIDVVRNGELVHSVLPDLDLPAGWTAVPLRVEWGRGAAGTAGTDWSGRLQVAAGHIVQTPYWSPDVVTASAEEVTWSSRCRDFGDPYGSERGGVELTVLGTEDTRVHVRTSHGQATVALPELARDAVDVDVDVPGRLRLQPGTGGLCTLGGAEQRLDWVDPDPRPGWYYVRAFQVDGEMAWSSPVFLDR